MRRYHISKISNWTVSLFTQPKGKSRFFFFFLSGEDGSLVHFEFLPCCCCHLPFGLRIKSKDIEEEEEMVNLVPKQISQLSTLPPLVWIIIVYTRNTLLTKLPKLLLQWMWGQFGGQLLAPTYAFWSTLHHGSK